MADLLSMLRGHWKLLQREKTTVFLSRIKSIPLESRGLDAKIGRGKFQVLKIVGQKIAACCQDNMRRTEIEPATLGLNGPYSAK